MSDGEPEHELTVREVATQSGQDERIVAAVQRFFPDAASDAIQFISKLPPESFLEGWVRGRGLYFDKSYKGTCFGGFKVGDQAVGRSYDNHVVHYSGRLAIEGQEIEGRWWIDPRREEGGEKTEGTFILRRARNQASREAASYRDASEILDSMKDTCL